MDHVHRLVTMKVKKPRVVLPFLQTLMGMTPAQRTIILAHIDDKSYDMLYDTISYVLSRGRTKIKDTDAKQLRLLLDGHKCDLRYLCNHKRSREQKRKRLLRMGGFPLGLIASTAIPMLLDLVTSAVKRK